MKLMVIDGNSIVNRAYYGIRPLSTRDGLYTHAIYGFLTTLQRLLDEEQPEALCVTFDRREPTFRHQADERYKAQRKGMPEVSHLSRSEKKESSLARLFLLNMNWNMVLLRSRCIKMRLNRDKEWLSLTT